MYLINKFFETDFIMDKALLVTLKLLQDPLSLQKWEILKQVQNDVDLMIHLIEQFQFSLLN